MIFFLQAIFIVDSKSIFFLINFLISSTMITLFENLKSKVYF